jgi:hypothetical protein
MGHTIYRVNIPRHLHVICVFKNVDTNKWGWFSNQKYSYTWYNSLADTVKGWAATQEDKNAGRYYIEVLDWEEDEL